MAMSRKNIKYELKHPTERVLIFLVVAIIALLAAILWVYGQKLDILWSEQHPTVSEQTLTPDFRQAIQSAQKMLHNPGAVDASAGRVYFPGLKIYVPLTNKSETLLYTNQLEPGTPIESVFSARSIDDSFANTMSDISCLIKPAGVSVDKTSDAWKQSEQAGNVKLADGRTLYLYKHSTAGCQNIYAYVSPDDIIASLKQAKSY
jgi:hypothetical protein